MSTTEIPQSDITSTMKVEDNKMEASEKKIPEDKVDEILEKLKRSGDIFEPKRGHVQKI